MAKDKKKVLFPKSTLIIRLIAGGYLVYLAYELLIGLRNTSTHFVIKEMDSIYLPFMQANVLNYGLAEYSCKYQHRTYSEASNQEVLSPAFPFLSLPASS